MKLIQSPMKPDDQHFKEHINNLNCSDEGSQSIWEGNVGEGCNSRLHQSNAVTKKDGTMRFCTENRKLNQHRNMDNYSIICIVDAIDAKYFSTLDLKVVDLASAFDEIR